MYEIMIRNKKTLELLESLILINLWYNSPEMHLYHKSHILTNLCIIMAIDMGLGGYSSPSPGSKRTEPQRNVPLTEIVGTGPADGRRPPKYDQIIHPFNLLDPILINVANFGSVFTLLQFSFLPNSSGL